MVLPQGVVLGRRFVNDLTVNEAEYHGLLLGFELLISQTRGRVIFCGDSNLVIKQMRGVIDCKAPRLQLLRHKALGELLSWPVHEFLRMKRDWNQSADRIASTALQREKGEIVESEKDRQDLVTLNRLDELLKPKQNEQVVKVSAVTRSAHRRRRPPRVIQEEIVQQLRIDRIRQDQSEEKWIADLKTYLVGDMAMDHIPSLPKSLKGNTELLIWIDLFSGYVIAKAIDNSPDDRRKLRIVRFPPFWSK